MEKIEKYTLLLIISIFFIFSLGGLSSKIIGDEIIYLFSEITNISYLDFIPGISKIDYFYGHPPGYPLILRILLDLSGESVYIVKFFNLTMSTLLLWTLYRFINTPSKNIASLFFITTIATNQLFIAHSTMIYPDITFFTFGILGWLAFQNKKIKSYVFWMFLCLFTRESGLAFLVPPLIISLLNRDKGDFEKKIILGNLILIFLLGMFFITHFYNYGSFFGNKELIERSQQGFSFLSINKEKLLSFDLNLFIIKSFATTLPMSLLLYIFSIKLFPKIPSVEAKQKLIYFPLILIIAFSLSFFVFPYSLAFRYHHILVNMNFLVKLIPAAFLFHLLINKEKILSYKIDAKIYLSISTLICILIFYFFYQDSSPRNLLGPIILYLLILFALLPDLLCKKSYIVLFSIALLSLQNIWLKVPQIPRFHTHPTLYKEFLTMVSEITDSVGQEVGTKVYSTKEFMDLIHTPLYGWFKEDQIKRAESLQDADLYISTNYYPSSIKKEFKKELSNNFSLEKSYEQLGTTFKIYKRIQ